MLGSGHGGVVVARPALHLQHARLSRVLAGGSCSFSFPRPSRALLAGTHLSPWTCQPVGRRKIARSVSACTAASRTGFRPEGEHDGVAAKVLLDGERADGTNLPKHLVSQF